MTDTFLKFEIKKKKNKNKKPKKALLISLRTLIKKYEKLTYYMNSIIFSFQFIEYYKEFYFLIIISFLFSSLCSLSITQQNLKLKPITKQKRFAVHPSKIKEKIP